MNGKPDEVGLGARNTRADRCGNDRKNGVAWRTVAYDQRPDGPTRNSERMLIMAKPGKPVPEGMHTITPHLITSNAMRAIDFYKQAFGAVEVTRAAMPDGRIMHAALKIGDSMIFLNDEFPEFGSERSPQALGGTPVTINLFVDDADAAFNRAVSAGAEVTMPLADQFWGDRYGKLRDPFGHAWAIAMHKEDLTPDEIHARQEAFFAGAAQQH
jgi:uncharacterized glyoxalase superfamily protein PhnB